MPIYEYRCRKCGKQFEYMQRMSEGPKRKCEECGALALERLISSTSFQLKGSGWYKDLYSSAKPAGADSGSDSGSGSGSDTGSDTGSDSTSADAAAPKATDAPAKEKSPPKDKKTSKKGTK